MIPLSEGKYGKYAITFSGFGCRGKGTLESQGATLEGKVELGGYPAKKVSLVKSGYEPQPNYEVMETVGVLLICLNPWTFWLCQ